MLTKENLVLVHVFQIFLYFRHGVKMGPGPRDPGPPSNFKNGTRDPPKV